MSTVILSIIDRHPGVEVDGFDRAGVIAREAPARIPIGRRNKDGISFPNSNVPGASGGCMVVGDGDGNWELHVLHDERPQVNGMLVREQDRIGLNDGDIIGIVQKGFTVSPAAGSARFGEFLRKIIGKGSYKGVAARIRVEIKADTEEHERPGTGREKEEGTAPIRQ